MKKKIYPIPYVIIILIVIIISLFTFSFFKTNKADNEPLYRNDFHKKYAVYPLEVPDSLTFANERVPLEYVDVREYLDRELLVNTYWQSHTILLIKRANKYFPILEPILKRKGIPDDFKYLAVAESELMNSISPSNAVGFWQFLEDTAKEYGLEISEEIDERYHLEKSTEAACVYLKNSYGKYRNWTLVAASYNIGRNGLDQQIEKQNQNSYYDLLLNDETSRYVYRILALKLILSNPSDYGFKMNEEDMYYHTPFYEVEVDSSIGNLTAFAQRYSTNYKMLKTLNPWLRNNMLTNNDKKKYRIKLPEDNARLHPLYNQGAVHVDTTKIVDL